MARKVRVYFHVNERKRGGGAKIYLPISLAHLSVGDSKAAVKKKHETEQISKDLSPSSEHSPFMFPSAARSAPMS